MLACNCQEYEIYKDKNTTVHVKMAMKLHDFYNIFLNSPEWLGNSDMIEVRILAKKGHKFQTFRLP